jgi:hypothetical protein
LKYLTLLIAVVVLAGCSKEQMLQKFASPEDQTTARNYVSLLQQGRIDDIERAIDPSLESSSIRNTLMSMAALIPPGTPLSVTLVGAFKNREPAFSTVNLTYEYQYPGKWLLINVALKKLGATETVIGFHVVPQAQSLEAQNRFTLQQKTPMQYIVLSLAVVVPMIILWALILCIRTKFKGRKWPWVLFILLGIGQLTVNWTTGHIGLVPLSVQLFGASASAAPFGPWMVAVSIPLGAIMFLFMRSRLSATESRS